MKQLIVTADDYGVFPSINEGIKESIRNGKVNSVAAISNYEDSVRNVKDLMSEFGDSVDIGCHLTITSGKPLVLGDNDAFTNGGYFRSYGELKITRIERQNDELEKELSAQIQVFLDNGIPVSNLSCHHTSLTFTESLFRVYLKVAQKFNLPMRSVNIIPFGKDNTYRTILQLALADDVPASKLREIKRFGEEIADFMQNNYPSVKTPSILESRHYGPPPFIDVWDISLPRRIREKHQDIIDFLEEMLAHENYGYSELMLHLIKSGVEDGKVDYPGIAKNYFDSRNLEFLSINSFDFGPYSDRIKRIRWKELP
jgi:predicted glycoside hydrolase/deacetylase ChbG (UPF0249 family)